MSTQARPKLYFHPLASYCWKVLIALYENDTDFEPQLVDLADPASSAELKRLWPFAKFPVLRDGPRTIPESSIIIEYLSAHYPGQTPLLPADRELALETRLCDRVFDLHIETPMQKIVGDRLRPALQRDPLGVEQARRALVTAYDLIEQNMKARRWAVGDPFTMADCAAAPALYYANRVVPFSATHPHTARYLGRLQQRASFARVMREAEPYLAMFPE